MQLRKPNFWKREWKTFLDATYEAALRDRRRRLGRRYYVQYSLLAAGFVVFLVMERYLLATAIGLILLVEVIDVMDELRELREKLADREQRRPAESQNTGDH